MYVSQNTSYVGRVSFGSKDAESGGLTSGDVSLKLVNVTLEDAGDYTCYVSSDQDHNNAVVSLIVTGECCEKRRKHKTKEWFLKNCLVTFTSNHLPLQTLFLETGSAPLLSAVWREDNMMNMSCESGGWYPEPSLRWSDQKEVLTPGSLKYSKDSSGLLSVHSWLFVPSSSEVSCSVGLSGEEAKEARVRLDDPPQPGKENCFHESTSSAAGWVAFALLLIATLTVLGVLYFKKRGKCFILDFKKNM